MGVEQEQGPGASRESVPSKWTLQCSLEHLSAHTTRCDRRCYQHPGVEDCSEHSVLAACLASGVELGIGQVQHLLLLAQAGLGAQLTEELA